MELNCFHFFFKIDVLDAFENTQKDHHHLYYSLQLTVNVICLHITFLAHFVSIFYVMHKKIELIVPCIYNFKDTDFFLWMAH